MKTFKRVVTGRTYDFNQVLYCSSEVSGSDEFGDIITVVIIDQSRRLMYKYKDVCFCSTNSDYIGVYDHARGGFPTKQDQSDILNHFNLNEG